MNSNERIASEGVVMRERGGARAQLTAQMSRVDKVAHPCGICWALTLVVRLGIELFVLVKWRRVHE